MSINMNDFKDIDPGERILMGPGPSSVHPRVLRAMSAPTIGHLDPNFLSIMNDIQTLLRVVFQTENEWTMPMSGTGSAGMETCIVNLVEPGDEVLVCVNGVFGTRMCDIVGRVGGKLIRVDAEWGKTIDPDDVRKAVKGKSPKVLAVVHAETSTGVCQPLEDLSAISREAGAFFLVDTVTSLGGMEVALDKMTIDAAYSGTQKCLSCPPGLSPVSFSPAAIEAILSRKTPVMSWYLDLTMISSYWDRNRKYHHTAPINMNYGLREALRLITEEGLEARYARHRLNHRALVAGIEAMGLTMLVSEGDRLPMLNAVSIPDGADDLKVRRALLDRFGMEIGAGLGSLAGKVWRVGLMGHSSCQKNVFLFLSGLYNILKSQGLKLKAAPQEAAMEVYDRAHTPVS